MQNIDAIQPLQFTSLFSTKHDGSLMIHRFH